MFVKLHEVKIKDGAEQESGEHILYIVTPTETLELKILYELIHFESFILYRIYNFSQKPHKKSFDVRAIHQRTLFVCEFIRCLCSRGTVVKVGGRSCFNYKFSITRRIWKVKSFDKISLFSRNIPTNRSEHLYKIFDSTDRNRRLSAPISIYWNLGD